MLQDFIIIVQTNIPISTLAPTHYVRFATHTLSYTFLKYFFQNFLGPFQVPQGLLPTIFEFPFSRNTSPNFPQVSTIFHFLLHYVELLMIVSICTNRGAQTTGRRPYMARIISTSFLRLEGNGKYLPPSPPLRPYSTRSLASIQNPRLDIPPVLLYIFRNNFFPKFCLGPFPRTQGLLPNIFQFPYSRYILSNFF